MDKSPPTPTETIRQSEFVLRSRSYRVAGWFLLAAHAGLLGYSAWCHSPLFNEAGHLASGLYTWQTGRFELFRVNPPLVRTIAAAPVALIAPRMDWDFEAIERSLRHESDAGRQFLKDNQHRALLYVRIARLVCIPLSLLGGLVCWRWSTELFGKASGLVALVLWSFSPYILGHASLITADAHGAAMGVAALYLFWRWLRSPRFLSAALAGILLGLAILAKMTLLVFVPLLLVLWYVDFDKRPWPAMLKTWKRDACVLLTVFATSLLVINAGYLFRGTLRPLGEYTFTSKEFRDLAGTRDRGLDDEGGDVSWVARIPVPLPEDFVLGVDIQKGDFEFGKRCYLRGQWRDDRGWWYFYLYALLVKVPLGTLALGLVALWTWTCHRSYRADRVSEAMLLLPAMAVLLLVSSQTRMTIHSRYLLPAFPFAFIWISRVGRSFSLKHFGVRGLTCLLLGWVVTSSLYCYPHSLSYFNELAGGPRRGHEHLLDSNTGWDQDLLFLKKWIEDHPEATPLKLASLGMANPVICGLEYPVPPYGPPKPGCTVPQDLQRRMELGPHPGWYAVDVNRLHGIRCNLPDADWSELPSTHVGCDHSYFRYFQPVAMAGYSVYIYHITVGDADRVRTQLGLPELARRPGR
jgi:hypothetical protein